MKEEVIQKAMEKVFLMVTLSDQESIIIKSQLIKGKSGSESETEAIDNLKAKLERGESLTEEEVSELREYIDSLRGTAEFLLQTAAELEAKLP